MAALCPLYNFDGLNQRANSEKCVVATVRSLMTLVTGLGEL